MQTEEIGAMVDQSQLEEIRREFEALVAKMQTPEHAAAADWLMSASESEIRAALEARYRSSELPSRGT